MRNALKAIGTIALITLATGCASIGGKHFLAADTGLPAGTRLSQISGMPAHGPNPNILPRNSNTLSAQRRYVGVFEQADVERYLNGLLGELQQNYPMETPPARVYLTPSTIFEAYTSPERNIFVSIGALSQLETEDQLLALLAHEYSHVLLSHSEVGVIGGSKWLHKAPLLALVMTEQSKDSIAGALALSQVVRSGVIPAFNREQETDADLLGIDLLALDPGRNPTSMLRLLEKLQQWENDYTVERAPVEVDWRAVFSMQQNQAGQTTVALTPDKLTGELSAWAMDKKADMERTHDDTGSRIMTAHDYLANVYSDWPASLASPLPWASDPGHPVQKLLVEAAAMNQLKATLENDNPSRPQVRTALRDFSAHREPSSAYGLWLEELADIELSNDAAATDARFKALGYREPLFQQTLQYIKASAETSPAQGLNALNKVRSRFGDEPEFIPIEIYFLQETGSGALKANFLKAKCITTLEDAVIKSCQRVMDGKPPW